MKMLNKKRQANVMTGLTAFVMGIVALAMVLAIGLLVLQEVQTASLTTAGATTTASNATGSIVTKLATAPTWIGILIIVGFATVVLSLFYVTRQ